MRPAGEEEVSLLLPGGVATSAELDAILGELGFAYKDTRRFTDAKGKNRVTLVVECAAGHPIETTMVSLKRAEERKPAGADTARSRPKIIFVSDGIFELLSVVVQQ